jgi:hypothetical protein
MFSGNCRLRKSKKPLLEKKFYLDLKNHGTAVKIEARLRILGAVSMTTVLLYCSVHYYFFLLNFVIIGYIYTRYELMEVKYFFYYYNVYYYILLY